MTGNSFAESTGRQQGYLRRHRNDELLLYVDGDRHVWRTLNHIRCIGNFDHLEKKKNEKNLFGFAIEIEPRCSESI